VDQGTPARRVEDEADRLQRVELQHVPSEDDIGVAQQRLNLRDAEGARKKFWLRPRCRPLQGRSGRSSVEGTSEEQEAVAACLHPPQGAFADERPDPLEKAGRHGRLTVAPARPSDHRVHDA
jgi:hypothetical protein